MGIGAGDKQEATMTVDKLIDTHPVGTLERAHPWNGA